MSKQPTPPPILFRDYKAKPQGPSADYYRERAGKRLSEPEKQDVKHKVALNRIFNKEKLKDAAGRRAARKEYKTSGQGRGNVEADRRYRAENKLYKGKYYGPDALKGDIAAIKAWKKAGKPNVQKFAHDLQKASPNSEPTGKSFPKSSRDNRTKTNPEGRKVSDPKYPGKKNTSPYSWEQ